MKRVALASFGFSVIAAWAVAVGQSPPPPTAKANTVELNGHTFTLPPGFTVERAAGPPLVDRPITADFDEQGRLYVSESSGTNDNVQIQLQQKPHRIVRLEDSDGDGRFDRRTVFADKMMFPEGTLWHAGSLYVAAPPSIWKLTDTDGDGIADRREEWFKGQTLTGCANDLHGPYLGPDGWIYWCKGAFAKQTHERPGQALLVTKAAHIFRARPDGTGVEPVMTGGMDNPVDVAFTPGGERIFTTTFFQHPAAGRRDGLVHAVYGGVYGKDHDPVYEHKWTSPHLMPVLTHLGAAAPSGLTRYESRAFGPDYQDNLFAALFNLHKVTRHVLEPDEATFRTRDSDLIVSSNLDFHPTDVLEDADGSVLVVDTGGWYKLCCPTSQLHKPDILGAIYRVRRTGAPRVDDPRGLKLAWDDVPTAELAKRLDDPRPAVRQRTIAVLAAQKQVPALPPGASAEARRNAIWATCRIDAPAARAAVRQGLADADETVRQVAIHAVSVWRDRDALPELVSLLGNASVHNRRAAAEAVGRVGDKSAVPALLAALSQPADRALEHSLTYALIEIADPAATAAGMTSVNPRIRRAALVALDQMEGGKLDGKVVVAEMNAADPALKEAAWWIAGRHPEWASDVAGVLKQRLTAKDLPPTEQEELARQLSRFAKAVPAQQLLADLLADAAAPADARRVVLRAMAQAGLREAPAGWVDALTGLLSSDVALIGEAVATARTLRFPPRQRPEKLVAALLHVGGDARLPAAVRLNALAAVPGGLTNLDPASFDFLRAQLAPELPVVTRSAAADVVSKAKLGREQLKLLAETLRTVGPLELDRLLDAFAGSADEEVGRTLVTALAASPGRSALRSAALKPRLAKFGPAVQSQAADLYASLDAANADQHAKLEKLLTGLAGGDIRRGQAVFHGPKAACVSCHALGYLGGKVGPDLTHIARIRTERDLLESIVFPNASFVRSYEPVQVVTKSGKVHTGLLKRDAADEVVLTLGADQEVRVPREDVEELSPGTVSVMPSGLDQQLSPQELSDLIAFLKTCK